MDSEEPKLFYGRINRLKFKLCHEFCESCYELGSSESQQKCSSCLPEFQYNYLAFINNNYEENEINCAPEEYFFDRDNKLTKCDVSNSKFYNTEDNKKICFDKSKDCPGDLHLNEQTGECFNCDLAHYNRGECTKEEVKAESCTQCNFDCYNSELCDFNIFDTVNEDFYVSIKTGGFISNYDNENGDLKISNGDGYTFQITTVENELKD